jgi:ABC-type nitrate/sulfonate/bicarbonate transport system permease component
MKIPESVQHWIVPTTVLAIWEAFGRTALLPHYLPPPTMILAALYEVAADGELLRAVFISLFRVASGFILGMSAGIFIGLAAGLLPTVRNFFDPLVSFLYAVPKIAFLPIFLLLFGLGHESKIAIVAFSCFFSVFIASRHAALSVGKLLVWTAQNMGTPRRTLFFRVFVPATSPQLFSGARIGLANSFVVLFAAELLGSRGGLGPLIAEGEDAARFDLMFAGIVTFAVLGFLADRVLMAVRRHMLRGQIIGTAEQLVR